jgi:hypothetical protein
MPDLLTTYNTHFKNHGDSCIVQDQGTCGLVSFWYAAQLLEGGVSMIPFPRKRTMYFNRSPAITNQQSLRNFAKNRCNSAQGEILSADEMRLLVESFGFVCDVCQDPSQATRRGFIRTAIGARHPVLIAYTWNARKNKPIPHGDPGPDGGAHWSLIIGKHGSIYYVLEPNSGTEYQKWNKDALLKANANAGRWPLAQFWGKTHKREQYRGPDLEEFNPLVQYVKTYDIYTNGRQQDLGNLLVSVRK